MADKALLAIALALVIVGWGSLGAFLAGNGLYHDWQATQYEPLARQAPPLRQICQTSACDGAIDAKIAQLTESSQAQNYWFWFRFWLLSTFELWTTALVAALIMVAMRRRRSQNASSVLAAGSAR
jgi:hypothetical protein